MGDDLGRWYMTNEDRLDMQQARLEGAVLDASLALYRKRTNVARRQWPEYEAWRQACAELGAFIGEEPTDAD